MLHLFYIIIASNLEKAYLKCQILHLVTMTCPNSNIRSSKDNTHSMIRILAKNKIGLKVVHINAQSLLKKIDEFRYIFQESDVDIICISETWFRNEMPDDMVRLDGYRMYRDDRVGHAGGVAMYVRTGICTKLVCSSSPTDRLEYLFLAISSGNNTVFVGCVYRPHSNIDLTDFMEILREQSLPYDDVIITGDFNSNLLVDSNLIDSMNGLGFFPVNTTTPTHFTSTSSTLLDCFFISHGSKLLLYDQLSLPSFSRHDLLFLTYNFDVARGIETICYRDFRNVDFYSLESDSLSIPWDEIYYLPTIDCKVDFFERHISDLYDRHVPLRTKIVKSRQQPWFNSAIRELIIRRDTLYNRWKRFRTPRLRREYTTTRREVVKQIRMAKIRHYGNKFSSAIDSRQKWREIRNIGIGKNRSDSRLPDLDDLNMRFVEIDVPRVDDVLVHSGTDTAASNSDYDSNTINDVFEFRCIYECDVLESILKIKSNATGFDNINLAFLKLLLHLLLPYITHIFNTVLTTSTFPSSWKRVKIIPIPKTTHDYRPIALLSVMSKALEKIMFSQMNEFVLGNKLLSERQSGFRAGRSCTTALLEVVEGIRVNMDQNYLTFLLLLDFSKAFDTVNHNIMIGKLRGNFKFGECSISLIRSYLTNRSQAVYGNGSFSSFIPVDRGVPQGSVLGPLLFAMYIDDIEKVVSGCNIHLYADDVQLYFCCDRLLMDSCIDSINFNMANIHKWALRNGLSLNAGKTKCLAISRDSVDTSQFSNPVLNDCLIQYTATARNLGVVFSNTLSWNKHIEVMIGQVYGMLRNLWSIQYFIPQHIRAQIAKSYLLSKILYGCEIFANCDYEHRQKLKVVANDIARFVYGIRRRDSISGYSRTLYNMDFIDLIKYRCLLLFHKVIFARTPSYLHSRIIFPRSTRSNAIIQLRYRYQVSERQFFINTIRLWNSLPMNLKTISNFFQFKKLLFSFFSSLQ